MIWYFSLQLVLNLCFVLAIIISWRRGGMASPARSDRWTCELVQTLEARVKQWESEMGAFRARLDEELRQLIRIGDQAQRILNRGQFLGASFSPSVEESELKAALVDIQKVEIDVLRDIPRLSDLEKTRERLKTELIPDLRTLLREQLA
jgi:hypothetical protein